MNLKEIIFFNHYRNGDCFISKDYVKNIISQRPEIKYFYAHDNHATIIQDLPCQLLRIKDLPEFITESVKYFYDWRSQRLYINTWVAPWKKEFFGNNEHANFVILHNIWKTYHHLLDISIVDDFNHYLPTIDFKKFNLSECNRYLNKIKNKRLLLFCNGIQQSTQSSVGDMKKVIDNLSKKYPQYEFLVTHKLDLIRSNITYTDDLFESPVGNLNQICFMSQRANLIVGKNSGPFSYCHTKENLTDTNKTFFCFSHSQNDTLTGLENFGATIKFSSTIFDEEIESLIDDCIKLQIENYWDNTFNNRLRYNFDNTLINSSFSQNWQDIYILSCLKGKRLGTYLEIGAGPPEYSNNTYLLSQFFDWTGVSIELSNTVKNRWQQLRPTDKILFCDALSTDFKKLLDSNFENKIIDYLQLDIDPSIKTLTVLKNLPLNDYRFRVITFETDFYVGDNRARTESRKILSDSGYELVVGDVTIQGKPFEDWWVDPKLVDYEIVNDLKNRSLTIQDPFKLLFN